MRLDLSLSRACDWIAGAQLRGADVVVQRVHTDSRSLQAGDLFVALRGERFDGHAYISQAQEAGAVAVLCEMAGEPAAAQAGTGVKAVQACTASSRGTPQER